MDFLKRGRDIRIKPSLAAEKQASGVPPPKGTMGGSAPLTRRKGLLNLRGRVKMTLRMQEKLTSAT